MSDKDFSKGYAIGYTKAIRDMRNQLTLDDEHALRLVTLVHWLDDREVEYTELLNKHTEVTK